MSAVNSLAGSDVKAGGQAGNCPLNFSLSEEFLFARKFSSKNTIFGAENQPFWENIGAKLKLWAQRRREFKK